MSRKRITHFWRIYVVRRIYALRPESFCAWTFADRRVLTFCVSVRSMQCASCVEVCELYWIVSVEWIWNLVFSQVKVGLGLSWFNQTFFSTSQIPLQPPYIWQWGKNNIRSSIILILGTGLSSNQWGKNFNINVDKVLSKKFKPLFFYGFVFKWVQQNSIDMGKHLPCLVISCHAPSSPLYGV